MSRSSILSVCSGWCGMRLACTGGVILSMIGAVSCAGIHVSTDYSHTTTFANYHTYSWLKVNASNQLWDQRIQRDVNTQLQQKGWMEVPSGGQAAVAAFGATHEQPTLETFYDSFGPGFGGWYWGGWGGYGWGGGGLGYAQTQTIYTPAGTLVVDVFNASNKHLIWRGMARQALSGNPEKNRGKLEHQVQDMFKKFPPGALG
jgi:Domain of unknown function (DUF4136)